MDAYVYTKETVKQPQGAEEIYVPNTIDLHVILDGDTITGIEIVDGDEEVKQACALATIWQLGNDPLSDDGNRWAELLVGEINIVQIMEDLTESVHAVSASVSVNFGTETASDGTQYFTYTIGATT